MRVMQSWLNATSHYYPLPLGVFFVFSFFSLISVPSPHEPTTKKDRQYDGSVESVVCLESDQACNAVPSTLNRSNKDLNMDLRLQIHHA